MLTDQANHTKKEGEPQFDPNKELYRNDRTLRQRRGQMLLPATGVLPA